MKFKGMQAPSMGPWLETTITTTGGRGSWELTSRGS